MLRNQVEEIIEPPSSTFQSDSSSYQAIPFQLVLFVLVMFCSCLLVTLLIMYVCDKKLLTALETIS